MLPPEVTLPVRGTLALRLIMIALAALTFLWMSFEDQHAHIVALLSACLALTLVMLWAVRRYGDAPLPTRAALMLGVMLGAVTGAGASLIAAVLMFFKNAWHAHAFPDFPLPMIGAMASRAFPWAAGGALMGLAAALLIIAVSVRRYRRIS